MICERVITMSNLPVGLFQKIFEWAKILLRQVSGNQYPIQKSKSATSIGIRVVDPGSCNDCEKEITALENPYYNIQRMGISIEASPRHADILLITGPLTRNMEQAVRLTFEAMPQPRRVISVGDNIEAENLFKDSYAVLPLPDSIMAAHIGHIPGDPPTPGEIIDYISQLPTM